MAHLNLVLIVILAVDGTSRKTMRAITSDETILKNKDGTFDVDEKAYTGIVMESDRHEKRQIPGEEGELIFFREIKTGSYKSISWNKLKAKKEALATWATDVRSKHTCTYKIEITATYW